MNADRINAVANAIETCAIPGLGFNMGYFKLSDAASGELDQTGRGCGTVACIAGWVMELFEDEAGARSLGNAAKILDLKREQLFELFYAANHPDANEDVEIELRVGPLDFISADQAVRTLRHLAQTGNVNWTV